MRVIQLLSTIIAFSAVLLADTVPVNNPSFENNANVNPKIDCSAEPGCWYSPGVIPDWIIEGGFAAGTFQPGAGSNREFNLPLPDGVAMAYLTGGAQISQTLPTVVKPNTTYTLKVDVGQRQDSDDGCCAFPGYTIALYAGSTLLGSSSIPLPPVRQFVTSPATYTSTGADNSIIGQPLTIRLSSASSDSSHHAYFDNVRLDATSVSPVIELPLWFWW